MQLVHHYPAIYWNTAVLQVEAGSLNNETVDEDEEDGKERNTNYGTVATAISMLQKSGVKIDLPNINKASVGFIPDEESNSILFGLKGVSKVNNESAKLIIENRPYASFNDFKTRLVDTKREVIGKEGKVSNKALITKAQVIMLIKAGAFDELENKPREEILYDYIRSTHDTKKQLSAKMITHIMELGMIDSEYEEQLKHYHFREYIKALPKEQDESVKSVKWHTFESGNNEMNDYVTNYFNTHFSYELSEDRDYRYDDLGRIQVALGTKRKGSFEALYELKTKALMDWLKSDTCLSEYNKVLEDELIRKYASGSRERWGMESVCLYHDKHECDVIDLEKFNVESFEALDEEPTIIGYSNYNNIQYPKFTLSTLCGTVLDKNSSKHTIALLTPTGVVNVKFQAGQFSYYDKIISAVDYQTGEKVTVEDSWFKKGKILFVSGYRSGQVFRAKVYKGGILSHSVQQITHINEAGAIQIQSERAKLN